MQRKVDWINNRRAVLITDERFTEGESIVIPTKDTTKSRVSSVRQILSKLFLSRPTQEIQKIHSNREEVNVKVLDATAPEQSRLNSYIVTVETDSSHTPTGRGCGWIKESNKNT